MLRAWGDGARLLHLQLYHVNKSCHTYGRGVSHVWTRRVTRMKDHGGWKSIESCLLDITTAVRLLHLHAHTHTRTHACTHAHTQLYSMQDLGPWNMYHIECKATCSQLSGDYSTRTHTYTHVKTPHTLIHAHTQKIGDLQHPMSRARKNISQHMMLDKDIYSKF